MRYGVAGLAILYVFGLLITVCNHGKHRSLSVAFEIANDQEIALVSIRNPNRPFRLRPVKDFMAEISSRLKLHEERFWNDGIGKPASGDHGEALGGIQGLLWHRCFDTQKSF